MAIAGGSGMSDPIPAARRLAMSLGVNDDPLFRQRFAAVHTRNEILRYLKLRTRTAMSRGERPGPEASIMKLCYAAFVKDLGDLAVGIQGPAGQLLHPDAASTACSSRSSSTPSSPRSAAAPTRSSGTSSASAYSDCRGGSGLTSWRP